jgi:WD40 repeat protein
MEHYCGPGPATNVNPAMAMVETVSAPALQCESGIYGISVAREGPDAQLTCHSSRLLLWDAPSKTLLWNTRFPTSSDLRVAFNPATSLLVFCSNWDTPDEYGTVFVWNIADGQQLYTHDTGSIYSIVFNPAGTKLFMVGCWDNDDTCQIWDAVTGAVQQQMSWDFFFIANFTLCDNIISLNSDGMLKVWNPDNNVELRSTRGLTFPGYVRDYRQGNAKLLIGKQTTICAAAGAGRVGVWDYESLECLFEAGVVQIADFDVGPDDKTIAVASRAHVFVWDIKSGDHIAHLSVIMELGMPFVIPPSSHRILFRHDGTGLYFFDAAKRRLDLVEITDTIEPRVSRGEVFTDQMRWLFLKVDNVVLM